VLGVFGWFWFNNIKNENKIVCYLFSIKLNQNLLLTVQQTYTQ
jgi:hypothetical protein